MPPRLPSKKHWRVYRRWKGWPEPPQAMCEHCLQPAETLIRHDHLYVCVGCRRWLAARNGQQEADRGMPVSYPG